MQPSPRIGRKTGFGPVDRGAPLQRARKRAATGREDVELTVTVLRDLQEYRRGRTNRAAPPSRPGRR
jgi:hypothetical protein